MLMKDIQKEILENKRRHNFNTTNIEQEFCYLYGEVREAYEAYHEGWDTLGEELADVINFLMGIAEIKGINLANEILQKIAKIGGYTLVEETGIEMQGTNKNEKIAMKMKDIQRKIHENEIKLGREHIDIEKRFCELYAKIGDAYDAHYKNLDTFAEELASVAINIMSIAEINGIDLGDESVRKVQRNKGRIYKRNELGYMVHL